MELGTSGHEDGQEDPLRERWPPSWKHLLFRVPTFFFLFGFLAHLRRWSTWPTFPKGVGVATFMGRNRMNRRNVQTGLKIPGWRRNLSRRLAKPALHNGRVQKRILRAFIASPTSALSTSEIVQWSHALALHQGKTSRRQRLNHCRAVRHAAEHLGLVRVGRAPTIGRPWLWRLKTPPDQ
jgi:hypothetical protein